MYFHAYHWGHCSDLKVQWVLCHLLGYEVPLFDQTDFYIYKVFGLKGYVGFWKTTVKPLLSGENLSFNEIPKHWISHE
jgi:hypothetical protein